VVRASRIGLGLGLGLALMACHPAPATTPREPAEVDGDDGTGEEVVAQPAGPVEPSEPAAAVVHGARRGELALVPAKALCVTHGALAAGKRATIRDASVRAVARDSAGDAGEIRFTYRGPSAKTSRLASGDVREQLGLKLRAADGCNLVYVVWRFAPKPEVVVQTKLNPGAHDNQQCGTGGYTRVKPAKRSKVAAPDPGSDHVLAATIDGTALTATIDGAVVWRGALPGAVRGLHGPVGVRTDNVAADLDLYAAPGSEESGSKCEPGGGAD